MKTVGSFCFVCFCWYLKLTNSVKTNFDPFATNDLLARCRTKKTDRMILSRVYFRRWEINTTVGMYYRHTYVRTYKSRTASISAAPFRISSQDLEVSTTLYSVTFAVWWLWEKSCSLTFNIIVTLCKGFDLHNQMSHLAIVNTITGMAAQQHSFDKLYSRILSRHP